MKTRKRKHARLTTCLFWLTLALIALTGILGEHGRLYGAIACGVAMLCSMTAMMAVRVCFLSCPYCGKGVARPYWKAGAGHEQFCAKCGKPFVYDDEPDAPID